MRKKLKSTHFFMKEKIRGKRLLSILLACIMMMSLVPTVAFAAEGDEVIPWVTATITGFSVGGDGTGISASAPTGANYTVEYQYAYLNKSPAYPRVTVEKPFSNGQPYAFQVKFIPNNGYKITTQGSQVVINGKQARYQTEYPDGSCIYELRINLSSTFNFNGTVDISGTKYVGETLTADISNLTGYDNNEYNLSYVWELYGSRDYFTGKYSKIATPSVPGNYRVYVTCGGLETIVSEFVTVTEKPSHNHSWSNQWSSDETHHWHNCTASDCNVTENSQKDDYGEHTGGTATCTAKAICSTCKAQYGSLGSHKSEYCAAQAATCTSNGYVERWFCSACYQHFTSAACTTEIEDIVTSRNPANHSGTAKSTTHDATYHWTKWDCCNAIDGTKEEHKYTNDTDTACDTCGYERETVTPYTVTFVGGEDTSGTAPTVTDKAQGETFTLPANTFEKIGFTFEGWNDGTSTYAAGASYTMPACSVTFTASWKVNSVAPSPTVKIVEGNDQEWTKGTATGISFKSTADFDGFTQVEVDDEIVASENYTAASGSTIVTLNASYLETLSVGNHTLDIVSTNGTARTSFTIKAASVAPIGSGGSYRPPAKPQVKADGDGGKATLSSDGKSATITPDEGYLVKDVTVNGISKGAVTEVTGLKSGDKVVVTFEKAPVEPVEPAEPTRDEVKDMIKELKLDNSSKYTSKKNVKINCDVDVSEFKALGYTVKYEFYRSTKKSSGYVLRIIKDTNSYINTVGKKGTKYYYKTKVVVYDKDGNIVETTEFKQSDVVSRTWKKQN